MDRTRFESKVKTFAVRISFRLVTAVTLMMFIPAAAVAQYPGGGATPSYGSKGAVIGGVAAGAVTVGLLYWKLHNRASLSGCVAGDGDKLVTPNNNLTYQLTDTQSPPLKTGERVELLGKKGKNAASELTFKVRKLSKDLGQCTATGTAAGSQYLPGQSY